MPGAKGHTQEVRGMQSCVARVARCGQGGLTSGPNRPTVKKLKSGRFVCMRDGKDEIGLPLSCPVPLNNLHPLPPPIVHAASHPYSLEERVGGVTLVGTGGCGAQGGGGEGGGHCLFEGAKLPPSHFRAVCH